MDGQTSSTYSEDTSPLGEEAAYAPPEDTQQDESSETSEISMVVHNGSVRSVKSFMGDKLYQS